MDLILKDKLNASYNNYDNILNFLNKVTKLNLVFIKKFLIPRD